MDSGANSSRVMTAGKWQHTIPRFYLNSFINPGWVYVRGSRWPKRVQSARKTSVKAEYYSVDSAKQPYSVDWEYVNSVVENVAAPVYKKISIDQTAISAEEKRLFAYFIANLWLRVPSHIEEMGGTILSAMESIDDMIKKQLATFAGKESAIPDLPPRRPGSFQFTLEEWKVELESMREEVKSGKPMIETTLSHTNKLAPVIADMGWVVVDAPKDAFFISSDCPVVLTDFKGSRVGAGWGNSNVFGTLPLTPSRAVVLSGSVRNVWAFLKASHQDVSEFNLRTISHAVDAVYSPRKLDLAQKWLLSG